MILPVKVHDSEINLICFLMATQMQFFGEAIMHTSFKDTTVCIGGILFCETENDNNFDKFAVAVKTDNGELVGHVPTELSINFADLLKDYGNIEVNCIGWRYNLRKGKGMEIPVDYKFIGNLKYLKKTEEKVDEALSLCLKKSPEEGNSHRSFKFADYLSQRF